MTASDKAPDDNVLRIVDGGSFLTLRADIEPGDLVFQGGSPPREILKLCSNGDILVNGRLAANDNEVVEGLRKLLNFRGSHGVLSYEAD